MFSPSLPSERPKELYQTRRIAKRLLHDEAGGSFRIHEQRIYRVRAGNWIREHRGIYRLALFPEP